MENVSYVALSSQVALKRALEVVANNVANMNTVAFKGDRMLFDQAVARASSAEGGDMTMTIDRATYTDMRQGGITVTDNPLDVAVQGNGWLQIETPDGMRYTRDGRMFVDNAGLLVNVDGHAVLDDGGAAIMIPDDAVDIGFGEDGTITVDGDQIGRLGLVEFDEPGVLVKEGSLLYRAPDAALPAPSLGSKVIQGAVEQSNVQPIVEMTRLIEAQRAYEAASSSMQSSHELQRNAVSRLGRVV